MFRYFEIVYWDTTNGNVYCKYFDSHEPTLNFIIELRKNKDTFKIDHFFIVRIEADHQKPGELTITKQGLRLSKYFPPAP